LVAPCGRLSVRVQTLSGGGGGCGGGCGSRAAVTALEAAAADVQRAGPRSPEAGTRAAAQSLLARAQERLKAAQAEVAVLEAATEKDARLQQLEEDNRQLRQLDAGLQCVVCMDAKKSVCLLPCKHMCMCQPCASKVMAASAQCLVCRKLVADSFEMFM
jgi:hypothetical protein